MVLLRYRHAPAIVAGTVWQRFPLVQTSHRAPEAVIEFKCIGSGGKVRKKTARFGEGDSIYDASGSAKLEAYRGCTIASGNNGETVGYGNIFEEEYEDIVSDRLKHPT